MHHGLRGMDASDYDYSYKFQLHYIGDCGPTRMSLFLQKTMKVGGVDRLTDTSKYTGSHKERFDETGKGKGLSGRENLTDNSGYVGNYKGSGTYDKSH